MNKEINLEAVISACDTLSHRVIRYDGCITGSARMFNACMRAFDTTPSAEAITFQVYYNVPVMKLGEATITRDGKLICKVKEEEQ